MTEPIKEGATVMDVLVVVDASLQEAGKAARAMGMTVDALRTTEFGSISPDQLRELGIALKRSPDELLAIANEPTVEVDRRKEQRRAAIRFENAAIVLAERAKGVAHLLRQITYADGYGSEQGAALNLLADALEDATLEVESARDELHRA